MVNNNGKKIYIEDLKAGYGPVQILKSIYLDILPNTVTALIGPSGCGKSTLVRCLNRMHETILEAYYSGKIVLDSVDIKKIDATVLRRRVGMVFQKPNPFPTMSIFENVASGLRINGVRDKALIVEKVEDSLKKAALWDEVKDKLKQSGTSISGGQQQRLCIARALAVNPEVLLMDEPCSALDPISTAKIEELIHELRQHLTIVIVTHNLQQAGRVADFTLFLLMGEMIEFGPTREIFTNPKKRKTEEYITGRFG